MYIKDDNPRILPDPKKLREEESRQLIEKLNSANWDNLTEWLESDNLDTAILSTMAMHVNVYQLRKKIPVRLSLFVQAVHDKNYVEICNRYVELIIMILVHDMITENEGKQVFEKQPKEWEFMRVTNPFKIIHLYDKGYRNVNDHRTDIMYDSLMLRTTLSTIATRAEKLVDGCDGLLDKLTMFKRLECIREFGLWNLMHGVIIEDLGGI